MDGQNKSTLSLLAGFTFGVRRFFALAGVTALLGVIFSFLTPQIIRYTVDYVIGTESMDTYKFITDLFEKVGGRDFLRSHFIWCAAAVVICALISGVLNYFSLTTLARGTESFTKNLRDTLFTHIQNLPFSWHGENQTGDIIQRCTSDVETVSNFISQQLIEVVRTMMLLAAALSLMFSMNVKLALISTAFIPVIVLYSLIFHTRISRQFKLADEAESDLTVAVQENLMGVRVVRAFGRERFERDKFDKRNDAFTKKWIDLGHTLSLFWGAGDVASSSQLLAVVCVGTYLAATGELSLGELLAFISYTQTLAWPVRNLGRTLSDFSKAGVSVGRLREILDAKPEPDESGAPPCDLNADIEFKNVSFSYGGQDVLRDVSFTIEGGTTFGILGATGSGKSTIAYLINRLYDVPDGSGTIKIGGVDVRGIDRKYLRLGVGLVLQEPFLFSKTVRDNISIASGGESPLTNSACGRGDGAGSADFEKIRRHAAIAAVDDNILGFKDGYDTIVGERGVTLSGGQKQRIAIARTLMLDTKVKIFDDSTSAVDMETDEKIRESLRENSGGTVILISHRINTLMRADKILVIDGGRVSQIGTHKELIARDGIYRRVYKLQSDAGLVDAAADNGEDTKKEVE